MSEWWGKSVVRSEWNGYLLREVEKAKHNWKLVLKYALMQLFKSSVTQWTIPLSICDRLSPLIVYGISDEAGLDRSKSDSVFEAHSGIILDRLWFVSLSLLWLNAIIPQVYGTVSYIDFWITAMRVRLSSKHADVRLVWGCIKFWFRLVYDPCLGSVMTYSSWSFHILFIIIYFNYNLSAWYKVKGLHQWIQLLRKSFRSSKHYGD